MSSPFPPPPPPRRRRWLLVVVAAWLLVVAYGASALVRGVGERVRSGGHPEMAAEYDATGLHDALGGRGAQRAGERLGLGAPAEVFEAFPLLDPVPYDRIAPRLARAGWQAHPCQVPLPEHRCWVKASPGREGVVYELRVQPDPSLDQLVVSVGER